MFTETSQAFLERALYLVFPGLFLLFTIAAACFKTYPTRRAILLAVFSFLVSVAGFVFESFVSLVPALLADGLVVVLFLADWISVLFVGRHVTASRTTDEIAALGRPHDVSISLENRSKRPITCEVVDDSNVHATILPPIASLEELTAEAEEESNLTGRNFALFTSRTLAANSCERLDYRLLWNRRGVFALEFVALRFTGALKIWRRYKKVPCVSNFRVYPNLCQLSRQELFARKSQFLMPGVRRTRRVGQDAEFERLRDYTIDDQYKFIDWRATARRNKLIVRDFQTTRNQRVVIALDAGRMTMNRSNGITLFDSALNSTLALAYIALRQGDEVGCLVFSDDVKTFIPPRGGASHMNAIIRGVFDVFPERVESRYDRAFSYLKTHSSKRALVTLATNVLDQRNADQIKSCMTGLCGAHLPLGLFLRERSLFDAVERFDELENGVRSSSENESQDSEKLRLWMKQYREADPIDELERKLRYDARAENLSPEDTFFNAGAAAEILNWRRKTLAYLEARGVLSLDVFPEDATAALVNKYLEIKARKLL